MLADESDGSLYTIIHGDPYSIVDDPKNIVYFPTAIGLTSIAVKEKRIVYSNDLEKDTRYNAPIDNSVSIQEVYNLMICPIVDFENEFVSIFSDTPNVDRPAKKEK